MLQDNNKDNQAHEVADDELPSLEDQIEHVFTSPFKSRLDEYGDFLMGYVNEKELPEAVFEPPHEQVKNEFIYKGMCCCGLDLSTCDGFKGWNTTRKCKEILQREESKQRRDFSEYLLGLKTIGGSVLFFPTFLFPDTEEIHCIGKMERVFNSLRKDALRAWEKYANFGDLALECFLNYHRENSCPADPFVALMLSSIFRRTLFRPESEEELKERLRHEVRVARKRRVELKIRSGDTVTEEERMLSRVYWPTVSRVTPGSDRYNPDDTVCRSVVLEHETPHGETFSQRFIDAKHYVWVCYRQGKSLVERCGRAYHAANRMLSFRNWCVNLSYLRAVCKTGEEADELWVRMKDNWFAVPKDFCPSLIGEVTLEDTVVKVGGVMRMLSSIGLTF